MRNITVAKLALQDRPEWEELFHAYMDFYDRTLEAASYDRGMDGLSAGRRHACPRRPA